MADLADWSFFFSFKPTWPFKQFVNLDKKIVFLSTGNQAMKTASAAYSYVLRILGMHPIEKKNIRPNDPIRIFRFSSETLPNEAEGKEVRNTQYPEFKKWLPPSLIKKDITIR